MAMMQPELMPLARRLHHVGIVVPDWKAAEAYLEMFGLREEYRGRADAFECWCLFCIAPPGQPTVELVVPEGGSLARFNRGAGGLHHHAYQTDDIVALTARFAARGIGMVQPRAVKGAGEFLCNFLDPVATRGALVEFVQPF